jgi:RNA polymerase sigma-70 factor (ECF subfamily)
MHPPEAIQTFTAHRDLLLSIGYRILGSWADAEDMVHETWLRWQSQDSTQIQSPRSWLRSTITRLCIDQLRSARHQLEDHYGLSAPEPSAALTTHPAVSVQREASLTMAFALLLENLKPMERTVFLLREAFGYNYAETALIVGKAEANCRQIARRARAHLLAQSRPAPQPNEQARRLAAEFISAAATGEMENLLALVGEDAPSTTDFASTDTKAPPGIARTPVIPVDFGRSPMRPALAA